MLSNIKPAATWAFLWFSIARQPNMRTLHHKFFATFFLLTLACALQVQTAPLPDEWGTDLIYRAKRSILWRWNTLRPVGASCREHSECGTKYCRARVCSFPVFVS